MRCDQCPAADRRATAVAVGTGNGECARAAFDQTATAADCSPKGLVGRGGDLQDRGIAAQRNCTVVAASVKSPCRA